MELSIKDRYIISNQLKILEALYPQDADFYANHRKAIEQGYKLHYSSLVDYFYDEMTEDECREILDILSMYRAITFSAMRLDDQAALEDRDLSFPGFDGNDEALQLSYVHYFIVDLGRFDELKGEQDYPSFNSHLPMLETYQSMLEIWRSFDNKNELNADQIIQLLEY